MLNPYSHLCLVLTTLQLEAAGRGKRDRRTINYAAQSPAGTDASGNPAPSSPPSSPSSGPSSDAGARRCASGGGAVTPTVRASTGRSSSCVSESSRNLFHMLGHFIVESCSTLVDASGMLMTITPHQA